MQDFYRKSSKSSTESDTLSKRYTMSNPLMIIVLCQIVMLLLDFSSDIIEIYRCPASALRLTTALTRENYSRFFSALPKCGVAKETSPTFVRLGVERGRMPESSLMETTESLKLIPPQPPQPQNAR